MKSLRALTTRLFHGREAHTRSFIKAVSWRVIGTLDTFVVSFFITGRFGLAGAIASTEVVTKVLIYYLHERAWAVVAWGHNR